MSKKEFEILIEKSNMTEEEAENRIFSTLDMCLDMCININDLYQNEHEREISKSI